MKEKNTTLDSADTPPDISSKRHDELHKPTFLSLLSAVNLTFNYYIMKKLFFIALPLILMAGCERYDRSIYVNEDAECCGVKNPIENMEWLNEVHKSYTERTFDYKRGSATIMTYTNDTTGETSIVVDDKLYQNKHGFKCVFIYDCNGTELDGGEFSYNLDSYEKEKSNIKKSASYESPKPCLLCISFFYHNTVKDTLATYNIRRK